MYMYYLCITAYHVASSHAIICPTAMYMTRSAMACHITYMISHHPRNIA